RTRRGARAVRGCDARDRRRTRRPHRQSPRARASEPGAAARVAACHRRDAAEGRGRHRGGALLRTRHPPAHPQPPPPQLFRTASPQSYLGLRGRGIGWGLPAAIGVKLALPERPVVGLIGDGSAMYTCQGLWTAARYRIDAVFVILNNTSYRILKQRLHAMRGL